MATETFWRVRLTPGTRRLHMAAFYAACLLGLAAFTFISQAQSYLLDVVDVARGDKGKTSGHLGVAAEIVLLVAVGIYGALSDRIGRRTVFVLGFVVVAMGLLLSPWSDTVLQLAGARVVFAVGAAAVTAMLTTVLADFAIDEDRGKAAGLLGVMNGLGAILTVFVLIQLPDWFTAFGLSPLAATRVAYGVVAALCLVMALWLYLALPRRAATHREETRNIRQLMREGLRAGRDPGIALAYAAAFVSRGNLVIVGTFFTLWLQDYGTAERGMTGTEALARAGIVIGVAQTCALCAAPVIGWLSDRIARVDALIIAVAISAVGYSSTIFVDDPLGAGMYLCAVFIGIGEVGGVIASIVLVGQQAPAQIRGSVIGTFSAFGAFGILTALEVGGWLFDAWRPAAPFVLFGGFGAVVVVFGLLVRRRVVPLVEDVEIPADTAYVATGALAPEEPLPEGVR